MKDIKTLYNEIKQLTERILNLQDGVYTDPEEQIRLEMQLEDLQNKFDELNSQEKRK